MSITTTDKIFNVDAEEYGYCCKAFKPVSSGKTIEVYVPKLMGAITKEGTERIIINKLFDNSTECMPKYNTKVTLKKSFTPKLKANCNWLDKVNSAGVVPKGTMFAIEFLNSDILNPYITTK